MLMFAPLISRVYTFNDFGVRWNLNRFPKRQELGLESCHCFRFRWYKTPDGKPLNAFGYEVFAMLGI
jgi:hypothetical protein